MGEMASRTLPLLYLNLGGEMMYVLDQRLVAQKVDGAKAAKGQIRIDLKSRSQNNGVPWKILG